MEYIGSSASFGSPIRRFRARACNDLLPQSDGGALDLRDHRIEAGLEERGEDNDGEGIRDIEEGPVPRGVTKHIHRLKHTYKRNKETTAK